MFFEAETAYKRVDIKRQRKSKKIIADKNF